jgi:hypothetical protein
VLAAVERAAHHRGRDTDAVPVWAVTEHLAVSRRSAVARHIRSRLAALHAAGRLERSRRHGVPTWELTDAGHQCLKRARRAGTLPALPESPQHRAWRNARTAATQEIERFRADTSARLNEALQALETDPAVPSDAWFELGEELLRACRRLGSASYCLHEWAEPSDDHADIDEGRDPADEDLGHDTRMRRRALRAGRRNIALWDDLRARAG